MEFEYLGCVWDELCTDEAEYRRKVASGRRVVDDIRSLVNDKGFQLECVKFFHDTLLVPVLMYGSDTMT